MPRPTFVRLLQVCVSARFFVALLGILLFAAPAHGTIAPLTGDAHVRANLPSANFGTVSNLYVGGGNTALLQFTLPGGVTQDQVARATLVLFVNRVNTGGVVNLSPVTSAWSESGVTYASMPSIATSDPGSANFATPSAGQYVLIDVSVLVREWVSGTLTNNGIALSSTVANLLLDSKENDETGHAAMLDITITSMGATGATGPAGPQGPAGQGSIGPMGPQGPAGSQGAIGPQGPQGAIGVTGATGATGVTGAMGAVGATGTIGAVTSWSSSVTYQAGQVVFCNACSSSGSSYVALSTNLDKDPSTPTNPATWALIAQGGATGPQGIMGAIGATGPTGATGVTGATGEVGATGTIGAVTNWSSGVQYQVGQVVFCSNQCASMGSSYVALSTNLDKDPSTPTNPATWSLIAQGGATGWTGPVGATGATGATGVTGAMGATGTVASIVAGTVTTGGSTGSLSVGGTASTPTININFPLLSVYGDGSDGTTAGVCNITSNTDWTTAPPGTIQCTSFNVATGVTLTVSSGTRIRATGSVTIDGTITVVAGAAQGLQQTAPDANQSGGTALPVFAQQQILHPGVFGGGNGGAFAYRYNSYGMGGGSISIFAAGAISISNTGSIHADGTSGGTDSKPESTGGGAGGIIILASKTSISNSGTLSAVGGSGGNGLTGSYEASGGGGGGIIHFLAPSGQVTAGSPSVGGGSAGTGPGTNNNSNGGGASGGSGGNASCVACTTPISAGAGGTGNTFTTYVADPATLLLP